MFGFIKYKYEDNSQENFTSVYVTSKFSLCCNGYAS